MFGCIKGAKKNSIHSSQHTIESSILRDKSRPFLVLTIQKTTNKTPMSGKKWVSGEKEKRKKRKKRRKKILSSSRRENRWVFPIFHSEIFIIWHLVCTIRALIRLLTIFNRVKMRFFTTFLHFSPKFSVTFSFLHTATHRFRVLKFDVRTQTNEKLCQNERCIEFSQLFHLAFFQEIFPLEAQSEVGGPAGKLFWFVQEREFWWKCWYSIE